MNERSRLALVLRALVACVALAGIGTATAAAEKRIQFNIAPQDLLTALTQFARQSDQEILFSTDVATSKRTSGVTGEFAPTEALRALLAGTGLRYRVTSENTILIERVDKEGAWRAEAMSSIFGTPLLLAQATSTSQPAQRQDTEGDDETSSAASNEERGATRLGQMTVTTGSHIPGAETASPILIFDRADIEKTGAATAQQFLATLPQNFGGGRSDDAGELPGVPSDDVFGSAANLRGLGSGTTLVLVNGRRLALAGNLEYVDISMIPLSAVERIEVLTDGASALYGADAIGGVVNFVMRKEYTGAETRLRGGWTTGGGGKEFQAGQTLGTAWSTGRALVAYEYYDRDALTAFQRDFTQNLTRDNSIIPPQQKHGVLVSAQQEIFPSLTLFVDGLYSERNTDNEIFQDEFVADPNTAVSDNQQYGGALGIGYKFGRTWEAEIAGGVNRDLNDWHEFSPLFPGEDTFGTRESEMRYADAKLTGELLTLPAGAIKLAVGGGYRRESYMQRQEQPGFDLVIPLTSDDFDVNAVFAELQVPLLGGNGDGAARSRLMLSLAGRYEEYSHFGDTFNPKFGIVFSPTDALRFRATYGTSFKAPTLIQTDITIGGAIFATNQATPSGPLRLVRFAGNNADLDPETATTWTAGMDIASGGFNAHVTYFDIEYEDRIETVIATPLLQLTDPAFAGTRVLRGAIPDADFNAMVAALLANPNGDTLFGCFGMPGRRTPCDEPATNFNAILDRRLLNLAGSKDRGIDLTLGQNFETSAGLFELGLNASYLFDFVRQFSEFAPPIELVDTVYLPPDFRFRASLGFSRETWGLVAWINHTDNYTDNGATPFAEVSSWTTLDLNFNYDVGKSSQSRWLENTLFVVNVSNLFDKSPPFLDRPASIQYDPANADPRGRTISISFNRAW